ncbi:hypothetical protein HYX15_01735 [Candidatus Woesearchaeota archaeon]|nr:hypothetical protein [Candidatus Woesearchaeota archaeon]
MTYSIFFNNHGLNEEEFELVERIAQETFRLSQEIFQPALNRCNFFVYYGYEPFINIVRKNQLILDPRIEGQDNLFDTHYWLAFDLKDKRTALIDPIFKYVGLERFAGDKLDTIHTAYYERKKVVLHSNVRLKTIGV